MAFRMGGNGNRRDNRGFDRGYGGNINRAVMNPWVAENSSNYRTSGGVSNDVLSLANNLVSNILRNQNTVPSLLDLPRGGNSGYGRDNYGRFDDRLNRMGNRNLSNRRSGSGARLKGVIKGGIRKPNPVDRAKKVIAKNSKDSKQQSDENTSADKDKSKIDSGKKEKKESKYADVPNIMFYCHMCKKHMWDATSFENHLKGRTHMSIRENIEHSYSLRANMIRHEAKIEEQLKNLEVDRLRRMGKAIKGSMRREYCTMCDLHFYGHLSAHRKTDGHLALKKFLHPKCNECAQEFPTRIDYDGHILSPEHMKKTFSTNSGKKELRKIQVVIHTEEDELKDLKEDRIIVKKEEKMETDEVGGAENTVESSEKMEGENGVCTGGEGDVVEGEIKKEGDAAAESVVDGETAVVAKKEEKVFKEPTPEPEDVILDYQMDDEIPIEVDTRTPRYNCNRSIASSLIHKLECYECHLCNRFLDTEKTAEIHTRTMTHHRNFVKFLNERANDTKIAQKRAAIAAEEVERRKKRESVKNGDGKKEGDESYDPTEATTGDEEDKSKDVADETMESQDGDEHFEDANATVKEEPVEVSIKIEEEIKEEPPKTPNKASPAAVTTPSNRGRGRGGRATKAR